MAKSNNGDHIAETISDTVQERMALYDAMPREMRDVHKDASFNWSAVGMSERAEKCGVASTVSYMTAFDRRHWRDWFIDEMGVPYGTAAEVRKIVQTAPIQPPKASATPKKKRRT